MMSEPFRETMEVGPPPPTPTRRRLGWAAAAAAAVAGAALVVTQAGWLNDDADATDTPTVIAHPLPSTPRALTAAVLAHIPDGVTVVWSTGSGGSSRGTPGIGPAVGLRRSLMSTILMRVGPEEFGLLVVTGPGNQAVVPDALGDGLITRDKQGRAVNELILGSANGTPTVLSESASPTSHGDLPLSDADLKAILADPLVGMHTDAATLARSKTLSSYLESPPPLTWEM